MTVDRQYHKGNLFSVYGRIVFDEVLDHFNLDSEVTNQ
jgi:hypothetical protein